MLVKISPNRIINTDAVQSIAAEAGDDRLTIRMTGGETIMADLDMGEADELVGTIVAAQPGYVLIKACPPAPGYAEPGFIYRPILAFRLTPEMVRPITAVGEPEGTWAIINPDGTCEEAWEGLHADADSFRAAYCARFAVPA